MTAGLVSRTALITAGAGRGIGAAIATGLAKAGANVILLARTADQLNDNTYQATPVPAEAPDEHVLRHKGLSLDFRTRTAAVQGSALDLTRSEFDLLHELLRGAQSARNPIWCVSSVGSTRTSIFVKPTNVPWKFTLATSAASLGKNIPKHSTGCRPSAASATV